MNGGSDSPANTNNNNTNTNTSSRRGRHRGGRRRVPLLHPGHGGRVAYVLPSNDITSRPAVSPAACCGEEAAPDARRRADVDASCDASADNGLPTLCPSCLPDDDPHFAATCGALGGGEVCPLVHASLGNATRFDVHRRDAAVDNSGESWYKSTTPVAVAMPNHRAEHEFLRPSTCLVTKADLDPPQPAGPPVGADGQQRPEDAYSREQELSDDNTNNNNNTNHNNTDNHIDPGNDDINDDAVDARDGGGDTTAFPQHCAHWLQRGICVYGRTCQFVHCVEPSDTAVHSQRDHWHATALSVAGSSSGGTHSRDAGGGAAAADAAAAFSGTSVDHSRGVPQQPQPQNRQPATRPPPAGGIRIPVAPVHTANTAGAKSVSDTRRTNATADLARQAPHGFMATGHQFPHPHMHAPPAQGFSFPAPPPPPMAMAPGVDQAPYLFAGPPHPPMLMPPMLMMTDFAQQPPTAQWPLPFPQYHHQHHQHWGVVPAPSAVSASVAGEPRPQGGPSHSGHQNPAPAGPPLAHPVMPANY